MRTWPIEMKPRLCSSGAQQEEAGTQVAAGSLMGLPFQLMKTSSATLPALTGWVGSPMPKSPPEATRSVSTNRRVLPWIHIVNWPLTWTKRRREVSWLVTVTCRGLGIETIAPLPGTPASQVVASFQLPSFTALWVKAAGAGGHSALWGGDVEHVRTAPAGAEARRGRTVKRVR